MDSKSTSVFAVVVTYNGMQWVDRCMGSLCQSVVPVSVVVVDNASTDGIVQYIRQNYPNVHVIETGSNLGFAKANNFGIRYALDHGADYVFLLNQDAWIENDTMGLLLESFAEHEHAGIVSPMHFNGAGTDLDWKFAEYMPGSLVSDIFVGKRQKVYSTSFVNAAAWLISRTCIERIGGFDTSLFVHYGEDSNYCQRVIYHGYEILLDTRSRICHDREFRKGIEAEYRKKNFQQQDLARKLEWGNILNPIDVDKFIHENKRSLLKARLKCRKKRIRRIKDEIDFLETVSMSRKTNIIGGLNWL